MKIAILTHRLGHNYGGMLQAYALRSVILSMVDADVETYHRHPDASRKMRIRNTVAGTIKNKGPVHVSSRKIEAAIMRDTNKFVDRYFSYRGNRSYGNQDLLIVGSDQVWRASYINPSKYMFDDVDDAKRRISYAASFGTDSLAEYSSDQVAETRELAQKFDAISVREESGVGIVKSEWGLIAHHHVDPTLLLSANDYSKVIDDEKTDEIRGALFAYVLDRNPNNNEVIEKIETLSGLEQFELMPKTYRSYVDFLRNKEAYIMPKVEQWLRSFRDAEFVVTDSFHGTVFSIIFNKPFIAVGNKARGLARFTSLLSMFGLEHRLVSAPEQVTKKLVDEKINWAAVNKKIKAEQDRSKEYLKKHLSKEA